MPLPVQVAICSVGELFGGVERHVLGLLGGLQVHGIEALLILFHDGELAAQARDQGIEPIILSNRNHSLWSTSQALAGILRRRQIRIPEPEVDDICTGSVCLLLEAVDDPENVGRHAIDPAELHQPRVSVTSSGPDGFRREEGGADGSGALAELGGDDLDRRSVLR